jgi:hypothetical protein
MANDSERERVEKVIGLAVMKTLMVHQGGRYADCGKLFLHWPHMISRNGEPLRAVCCECATELYASGAVLN